MEAVETQAMVNYEDRHWWYRGRRRIVLDELARLPIPRDARVLDAGCGSGRLLDSLSEFGRVSGLDMRAASVELARSRGHDDVRQGVVEALPWEDGAFDLLTSLDVIEHTADDRVALRELRRVTKPGGRFLMTVPAYQVLWSNHDVQNQHYRRYDRRMLRTLAVQTEWHVERLTFFNSVLLPPAAAVRLAQRFEPEAPRARRSDVELGPPWLYPVLELPLKAEAAWLRSRRTLPLGLSLLAVLRR